MARVTGIGGVFYRVKDPAKTRKWYADNLGFKCDDYGANFVWSRAQGYTLWSPFPEDSEYMAPSTRDFMINFSVDNLEEFVEELRAKGATILTEPVHETYGSFAQILDCDGVKVELAQLNPDEYEKIAPDSLQ